MKGGTERVTVERQALGHFQEPRQQAGSPWTLSRGSAMDVTWFLQSSASVSLSSNSCISGRVGGPTKIRTVERLSHMMETQLLEDDPHMWEAIIRDKERA